LNKIDINLAIRKKEVTAGRAFLAVAVLLGVVALIFSAYNIYEYSQTSSELKRYKGGIARLEKKIARREPGLLKSLKVNAATVRGEVEFINTVIDKKSFMWTALLSDLEAAVPKGVYLVSIKPDFAKEQVNLTGVARTLGDALRMVDSMGASPRFKDVYLLKHKSEKATVASSSKLLFDIRGSYMNDKGL